MDDEYESQTKSKFSSIEDISTYTYRYCIDQCHF